MLFFIRFIELNSFNISNIVVHFHFLKDFLKEKSFSVYEGSFELLHSTQIKIVVQIKTAIRISIRYIIIGVYASCYSWTIDASHFS